MSILGDESKHQFFFQTSVPNDSSKLGYHKDTIINKNSHYSDNILSFRGKQKKIKAVLYLH